MLFQDARDVRRIKIKMVIDGVKFQDLQYREMEKLRQVSGLYGRPHRKRIFLSVRYLSNIFM